MASCAPFAHVLAGRTATRFRLESLLYRLPPRSGCRNRHSNRRRGSVTAPDRVEGVFTGGIFGDHAAAKFRFRRDVDLRSTADRDRAVVPIHSRASSCARVGRPRPRPRVIAERSCRRRNRVSSLRRQHDVVAKNLAVGSADEPAADMQRAYEGRVTGCAQGGTCWLRSSTTETPYTDHPDCPPDRSARDGGVPMCRHLHHSTCTIRRATAAATGGPWRR